MRVSGQSNPAVLVVEDDEVLNRLFCKSLTAAGFWAVDTYSGKMRDLLRDIDAGY
ncbi:MAG: hypothetical protein JXQ72_16995 [Anaerolineae bacterium]|nr:hypothetical protein [Anaerolineae bacterium]